LPPHDLGLADIGEIGYGESGMVRARPPLPLSKLKEGLDVTVL
jgi:hypothetical protein